MMGRLKALVITVALELSFTLGFAQESGKFYWYYYTVDRNGPTGTFTTLVYDKKGLPNVAYFGTDGRRPLKFAHYDGNSWEITVIDSRGEAPGEMAFDAMGFPNVIYQADDGKTIRHASYDGQQWKIRPVANNLPPGGASYEKSIQVDSQNRVHMCYSIPYADVNSVRQMTYSLFTDTTSTIAHDRIDPFYYNGKWNSLALGAHERPAVAYWRDGTSDLLFAERDDSGIWATETIEESSGTVYQGYYPSVKYDGSKNIYYIAFLSQMPSKLRLAFGDFGAWQVEDIVEINGWTTFSTPNPLALDRQGNPYIAFHDTKNGNLKLIYKLDNVWYAETVDSIGQVGEYASLQFDPLDMPAISYYNASRGYLQLAVGSLTPPTDSDADKVPDYLERANETNPFDADSDDDGLSDGEEDLNHNGMVENYEVDPRNADTDNDGIPDGVEMGRVLGIMPPPGMLGTDTSLFRGDADPTTWTNPLLYDTDGDGLSDGEEDKNANGRIDLMESDPNNPDSDSDGLTDGIESRRYLSPIDIDSDDDGLADGIEDKNHDGVLDEGETDPGKADTDGDDLLDGLELGVTIPVVDPDGQGRLLATDLSKFRPDVDPSTITDPRNPDSDNDRLRDGVEDKNHNGRFDRGETDPQNADTDGDGLRDGIEVLARLDPLDLDSDDDGVADGLEDADGNGIIDGNETSPRLFDSDGDGVSDGVELGLTAGIIDPDGDGPLHGTDDAVFNADSDPNTNSNPLLWDTDGDGLSDGEEDINHNGAVDVDETHFLLADTDDDGFADGDEKNFGSDPLDAASKAQVALLFRDNFHLPDLQNWNIVDEGIREAPSDWFTHAATLIQTSNIWGDADSAGAGDARKPGTYIRASNFVGINYKLTFKMLSSDNDELGVMFNYHDRDNYYLFSMNSEQHYRRVIKIVNGQASVMAIQEFSYQSDRDYDVLIFATAGKIQIYLDNRRIFNLQDSALTKGGIAFYCWKNAGALFKDVLIMGQGSIVPVDEEMSPYASEVIRSYSLSAAYPNPTSGLSSIVLQAPQPVFLECKIFDVLGRLVRVVDRAQYSRGVHEISWDGYDNIKKPVPTGIYFMLAIIAQVNHPEQILCRRIEKVVRIH